MKNLNLVVGMSLGLLLAGCPGDDTGDDGASSGDTNAGTTMGTSPDDTSGDPPDESTGDPPDDTTGDPPDDTTGDPPDDTTGDPTTGGEGRFAMEIYPIIEANCSCHVGGNSGMLPMPDAPTAYGNLVGVASAQSPLDRIAPGSTADSYVWAKLNGEHRMVGGSGQPMPLMADPLMAEPLGVIEQWILDGAEQ